MEKKTFSSSAFEGLSDEDRRSLLDHLEQELVSFIGQCASPQQFLKQARKSVELLRTMGHDLWSVDSDKKTFEIWESDYVRPKLMGRLVITFKYPRGVRAEWTSL